MKKELDSLRKLGKAGRTTEKIDTLAGEVRRLRSVSGENTLEHIELTRYISELWDMVFEQMMKEEDTPHAQIRR